MFRRSPDFWSGLALLALGVYIVAATGGWEYLSSEGPGPAFFPRWYGVAIIGPPATIAMLLPLTSHMDPAGAMIMLAGIYYGAKYGGSTTSILLNVPGESASVVTCIDGYQLARKGRAGAALGIAAIASFIAGT